jgi:hypothetical protein
MEAVPSSLSTNGGNVMCIELRTGKLERGTTVCRGMDQKKSESQNDDDERPPNDTAKRRKTSSRR